MAFGWTERGQQHGDSSDTVSTPSARLTYKQMLSLKEFKWHFLMERRKIVAFLKTCSLQVE